MSDPFSLNDDLPAPLAPWLQGLNPEQTEAVTTTQGPVLVLSGAGTGKTRVLTARLAHILSSRQAWPRQCLAVTFTNKAAREMQERLSSLIGPPAQEVWLGTFHALCARLLRRHPEMAGLKSNFTILDSDDQTRLLKQVMAERQIDPKAWPPAVVMTAIQAQKDRAQGPDDPVVSEVADGQLPLLYRRYQQRLQELNACDFGDLLLHVVKGFRADAALLEHYQDQFMYILVDEYQDTNSAQYMWLRLLAQKHRNICCVGDDDQSIYSWRGAEVGNILRFESDFPGAKVIRLESNYRSTPPILAAASHLISHNTNRLGKTLRPALDFGAIQPEKVKIRAVWDGPEEARAVSEDIEALLLQGEALSSMAILVRAGFQTREFEERLIAIGLGYTVIGGPRFYERQEIRDIMAYLRLINSPDDGLAFERIINLPRRGLGESSLQAIHIVARARSLPLFEAARLLSETDELKAAARKSLVRFTEDILRWRSLLETLPHPDLARQVLDESGYLQMWKSAKALDAPGRVENLGEFLRALEDYPSLQDFLEHVALVMENEQQGERDRLSIMTLHGAKGLEFDTVFLPGWEEGVFPHQKSLSENGLEEERRLAYVGLTRARRRARIFCAANRRIYNQWQTSMPSRFLDELPDDQVIRVAAQGLHAGGRVAPKENVTYRKYQEHAMSPIAIGDGVRHNKFGIGEVVDIEGDKLVIRFEGGEKKILRSFVDPL